MADIESYRRISEEAGRYGAEIVAVSKKKPAGEILKLMEAGQRKFGENYVQELLEKRKEIPGAEWHFIGHLQTNKVKQVVPFVTMIQSADSIRLLHEINKQAHAAGTIPDCLIEVRIAKEETKTGMTMEEANELIGSSAFEVFEHLRIRGLMGMATLTDDEKLIRSEFRKLKTMFDKYKRENFNVLSMGMTSDYKIALDEGSTMIRIGSAIFGERS